MDRQFSTGAPKILSRNLSSVQQGCMQHVPFSSGLRASLQVAALLAPFSSAPAKSIQRPSPSRPSPVMSRVDKRPRRAARRTSGAEPVPVPVPVTGSDDSLEE